MSRGKAFSLALTPQPSRSLIPTAPSLSLIRADESRCINAPRFTDTQKGCLDKHPVTQGVPEGSRRTQGDEQRAHRDPRDRLRAVGAADRHRSPVVAGAEVGTQVPGCRRLVNGSRFFWKLADCNFLGGHASLSRTIYSCSAGRRSSTTGSLPLAACHLFKMRPTHPTTLISLLWQLLRLVFALSKQPNQKGIVSYYTAAD